MNAPTLDLINQKYVSRTPQMVDCGMRVTAAERGRGTMTMPARADWVGDPVRNVLHPGALTVLADSACGLAVMSSLPQPLPNATLDLRMDWLRPASPGHDIHCEARCERLTRSVAFVDAGMVTDALHELSAKVGVGMGGRWRSPIGPIQLDLAYALASKRLRLHLRLGFTF